MAIETSQDSYDSQQQVLADIRSRTGRWFAQIAAIDTSESDTANAVLPILAEWVSRVPGEDVRAEIYSRFLTVHSNAYIERMLQWAESEPYDLGRGALVQAITKAARPKDAVRIWNAVRERKLSGFDAKLLAKLSTFPVTANEVKGHLVARLASPDLDISDIQYIAKVEDPRVVKWFAERVDSPDPRIRLFAIRVASKGKALPRGLSYATDLPNRLGELFSTEIDISELDRLLEELASRFSIKIPDFLLGRPAIWSRAETDRWVKAQVGFEGTGSVGDLWFRLEDIDVIEVVLVRSAE
jgi:hypothetical protein